MRVCACTCPFFELDSSETRELDKGTMQTLAECMISGPLRAERVKRHLVEHRASASPQDSPKDRRVDVELVRCSSRYASGERIHPTARADGPAFARAAR